MATDCEDDEGSAADAMREIRSWLHAETFEGLAEVNAKCLELLADQARTRAIPTHPMLRELGDLWRALDPAARRRAACCPYLVVDAGFSDSRRWRSLGDLTVHARPLPYGSFFTVPRATEVTRLVFTYAWHLARSHSVAARVLLGMPSETASLIASCTLPQISELAEQNSSWLRPRWPSRVQVWREFLMTAETGEGLALERARLHGLQLLAGESLVAAHSAGE
ncbi:MAG TPA: hypothetical protein VGM84_17095 [Steroidobacteraceae bacterium]|jgi:hypothetical protein